MTTDAAQPPERSEISGAPGLEGEAVERVRAALDGLPTSGDEDYDEIERLIDTDPIALGARCRTAEHHLRSLLAALAPAPAATREDGTDD